MEGIKLFMWGFQRHFQNSVQNAAEKLFHELDPGYEVETFLLGLVRNDSPEDQPICLEPEECGFVPDDFDTVRDDVKHFRAVDPDRNVMATHESHMRSIQKRIDDRAERRFL